MEAPPNLNAPAHPIESNENKMSCRAQLCVRQLLFCSVCCPWRAGALAKAAQRKHSGERARLAFTNFSIISRKQATVDKPVLDDIPRRYSLKLSKK